MLFILASFESGTAFLIIMGGALAIDEDCYCYSLICFC